MGVETADVEADGWPDTRAGGPDTRADNTARAGGRRHEKRGRGRPTGRDYGCWDRNQGVDRSRSGSGNRIMCARGGYGMMNVTRQHDNLASVDIGLWFLHTLVYDARHKQLQVEGLANELDEIEASTLCLLHGILLVRG